MSLNISRGFQEDRGVKQVHDDKEGTKDFREWRSKYQESTQNTLSKNTDGTIDG